MALHCLWLLLLCLQTWSEAVGRNTDVFMVNGILGESVTFPVNIQESQQVINIAWISKTSVAIILPGESGRAPKVTVTHNNYFNRLNVSGQNYNLVISNLKMEDAGLYKADINIKGNDFTIAKNYSLQVYRRLGKPKITESLISSMNNSCNITLTCSMEEEEKDVIYRWSPLEEEGDAIRIFLSPEEQELTYTCTAQNPVSNNSNSVSTQHLCADIAMGLRKRHTGLLSVLALLILLVLILSPMFLFRLFKRRQGSYLQTFTKSPDTDSKIMYEHITVLPRVTQPTETRIYDEISQPKVLPSKESTNTIYSTVQYFDKMGKNSTCDRKPPGTSSYEIVI
ncbi:SLAM family member 5 [Rhynchocyon petersi]